MAPPSALTFKKSIGVVTHVSYLDTVYGDWDQVLETLDDIGIITVRDGIYFSNGFGSAGWNDAVWGRQIEAGQAGVKFIFATGNGMVKSRDTAQLNRILFVLMQKFSGYAYAIEGPNEYDIAGDTSWIANLRWWQQKLWDTFHPYEVPVVAPSFAKATSPAQVGTLPCDFLNFHPYTGATRENPTHLAGELSRMANIGTDKFLVATEHGTSNAMKSSSNQVGPENIAAPYLLSAYLEHFKAGFTHSCAYELINYKADTALTDMQAHYGLLRNNWTYKPAATQLKNMLTLVGESASTSLGDLTISCSDASVRTLKLQAGGKHLYWLWRNSSLWDRDARKYIPVLPANVTITCASATDMEVGVPANSGTWQDTSFTDDELVTCLGGDPICLRITV